MAKTIFPGNYTNRLSGYQNQAVLAEPGRAFYQVLGYALVTATGANSWPITIPSPDLRADDKPRPDRVGLVIPVGAQLYSIGFRIPDMRRDRSVGTAISGLVGTNTNRLKLADAVANDNTITAANVATSSVAAPVASGTITPRQVRQSLITPVALTAAETLLLMTTDSTGTVAGSNLTSDQVGGTPIIVEVNYMLDDDVAGLEDVRLPFRVEN
jgi:hypothetical protein